VKQADYFSQQSKDPNGLQYANTGRRIYQLARAQYDLSNFRAARKLASAAREVVNCLKDLAQATVRIPEPPRM